MNKRKTNTTKPISLIKSLLTGPLRLGALLALGFFGTTIIAVAITGTYKTDWTATQVLKASDLNTNFSSLQTAITGIPNWTKASNGTDAVYTAGRVGILTSSPQTALEINGVLSMFDSTKSYNAGISTEINSGIINFGVNDSSTNRFGGTYTQADQGGFLRFDTRAGGDLFTIFGRAAGVSSTSGSVLMSILSNGNTGIGTTPTQKFTVNGNAGNTTGVWVNNSDVRLKKNIEPLSPYLDRLTTLRPVTFEWKEPAKLNATEGKHIGFIAQEVEKVFPNWVDTDKTGYKWLNMEGVNAAFVRALQELVERDKAREKEYNQKLSKLEDENAELKARLASFERKMDLILAQKDTESIITARK
jgi:hypothetical protein